jgi:hypothetical protein
MGEVGQYRRPGSNRGGSAKIEHMELIEQKPSEILIRISEQEAVTLNNSLNEVCNGIEVPEFDTRMGCSVAEAQKLLSDFHSIQFSN